MTRFGCYGGSSYLANSADLISEIITPLSWPMTRFTKDEAPDNEYYGMFRNCSNLNSFSKSHLPQNITPVGNNFCSNMFSGCSSLFLIGSSFNIPENINYRRFFLFEYVL